MDDDFSLVARARVRGVFLSAKLPMKLAGPSVNTRAGSTLQEQILGSQGNVVHGISLNYYLT
jgi:hypothetical protein